ncbi:T6SS effector amidase Tae4 family protein [Burkholderia cepacia]|uniref:T6SS effector amidase Tae4 family protein n=1 Tax=Burkholderia cepacia TaxID=292 RepID=UPI001CF3ADE7|nr:T6SS effector amidase Tae4 family protein [Burkholderia cepacia]MCA8321920.1 type VI secretion system amidase effector protein Tae4 [Burkholderia cepacia]
MPLTEERSLETTVLDPGNKTVSREALFQELGWQDLIQNPSYANTCAIRISVALVKSGITLRGGLVIQKGPHRGRRIEAGQARLAKMLAEPAYFGKAEVFRRDDAVTGIASRKGMAAFWNIPGYMNGRGGHIDLIDGARAICGSDCYWTASEMWFWPLR